MKEVIKLVFEKETPGTFRYKEQPEEGEEVVIGTLYIKKGIFEGTEKPEAITVTIESTEEEVEEEGPKEGKDVEEVSEEGEEGTRI